jgi:ribonuclease D
MQDDILGAIERGQHDSSGVFRPAQLTPQQRSQLKTWRSIVQSRARELDVDPALLASRRQLEQLLQALEEGQEPPERFQGWRRDVLTRDLLDNCG